AVDERTDHRTGAKEGFERLLFGMQLVLLEAAAVATADLVGGEVGNVIGEPDDDATRLRIAGVSALLRGLVETFVEEGGFVRLHLAGAGDGCGGQCAIGGEVLQERGGGGVDHDADFVLRLEVLEGAESAFAQRFEDRAHAVGQIEEQDDGERKLVLAEIRDSLRDAVFVYEEILWREWCDSAASLLIKDSCVEGDDFDVDVEDGRVG